jgi:general secretion pathway protein D
VTPQVEPDNNTISLDLKPQVLEFVRYDTAFNSTINLPAGFGGGVIDVIYSMPILSARTIETRVTIWDGETIMLGGLVTEDVVAVDDRVPYLSDIPYVGRIFRNKGQHNTKRNLLVFVTARLIDPSGLPKRPNFDRALPDFKRL